MTAVLDSIEFPPGVNDGVLMEPIWHSAWRGGAPPGEFVWNESGAAWRRYWCRDSPLRFAMAYFMPALRNQITHEVSFCQFHVDVANAAKRWMDPACGARDAWVLPRNSGKTVWFGILLVWALAFGHRKYVVMFCAIAAQSKKKLLNIRKILRTNQLLLADFPELRMTVNTAQLVELAGGGAVAAYGLDETTLGDTSGSNRPDLITGDDLEKGQNRYTLEKKAENLLAIRQNILPMNAYGVVQLTGTVTMPGSMMHDVVKTAKGQRADPWVTQEGFTPHYYQPIIVDPVTGVERSYWPRQWPMATLVEERVKTQEWAISYLNDPSPPEGSTFWRPHHFKIDESFHFLEDDIVLWIDPASTQNKGSDPTALAVVARGPGHHQACVMHSASGLWTPSQLDAQIAKIRQWWPSIKRPIIETNGTGGQNWQGHIKSSHVEMFHRPNGVSKEYRIGELFDHYEVPGRMSHRASFEGLERQMMAWPDVRNDDLVDAVASATERLLGHLVRR